MDIVINLNSVIEKLKTFAKHEVTIIAVSKTFSLNVIRPLLNAGQIHFGENRINEALEKWTNELLHNPKIQLHLIGRLQSNKVKDAVKIFLIFILWTLRNWYIN